MLCLNHVKSSPLHSFMMTLYTYKDIVTHIFKFRVTVVILGRINW